MLEPVRRILNLFKRAERPPPEIAGIDEESYTKLREQVLAAANNPPRIALIGETGVGKSSSINGLFNAGCEISHQRACTQIEHELTVDDGKLHVFDMPGLGEDLERDEVHKQTYARVLPTCDVVLWIVKADTRAITGVQRALKELTEAKILDPRRLVVGINQIDLVQPGSWNKRYNIPSKDQEATIAARVEDIREKISKIVPLAEERIVPYSALKRYHLRELLTGIEAACDRSRVWVIQELANCANFEDLAEAANE